MLTINTNLSSLIAQNSMKTSTNKLNQAIERMTTGFKINHAKDNAANYSISTNMTTQIGAYQVAEENALQGLDMISTAEGTLDQIQDKLQRLRALAEQAGNGTYGAQSQSAINAEANALVDEIERLYSTAEYNGLKLFGDTTNGGADAVGAALTPISETPSTFSLARTITVDETKRVSNVTSFTEGETYYISTSDDLVALENIWNTQQVADATIDQRTITFELANDIDMSGVEFNGIGTLQGNYMGFFNAVFNGNGYAISNLTTALFARAASATITDLNLNVNITDGMAGLIRGSYGNNTITNCKVSGTIMGSGNVGGIIGAGGFYSQGDTIDSCVVNCNISGEGTIGGIIGLTTDPDGNSSLANYIISNCEVYGESDLDGVFVGSAYNGVTLELSSNKYNNYYDTLGIPLYNGTITADSTISNNVAVEPPVTLPDEGETDSGSSSGGTDGGMTDPTPSTPSASISGNGSYAPAIISLQIGTSSDSHSNISFNVKFSIEGLEELRNIGLSTPSVATFGLRSGASPIGDITRCDEILATIQEKLVEFGAVANRLESVLEEITIQRDNLISSRSTIRDADIAEVSSTYIQQQILQQASATLLATANQSPSIALQLI